jgi:predicted pyridoxine 5'-phosphate oxidase superfamily flavin-nucleotide-binding protein
MRQIAFAIAWLVAVIVIAFGAAGIVAGMDAPATTGSYPWQTARDDVPVGQQLDVIAAQLEGVSAELDALGVQARGALSALVANEPTRAATALETGDALVADIRERSLAIGLALSDVPLIGTPAGEYRLGPAVRERHARLVAALAETQGLDQAWARLAVGSASASRLSELLATHDETVLKAAAEGRDADYAEALKILDDADALIADSRALRNRLANTVDVTTLDEWLDRSEGYDVALRALYDALRKSEGRVTSAVRRAMTEERKARDRLPPDTRGLVVIMAEIGRGGMNGAVIAIEQARGELADLLAESEASPAP